MTQKTQLLIVAIPVIVVVGIVCQYKIRSMKLARILSGLASALILVTALHFYMPPVRSFGAYLNVLASIFIVAFLCSYLIALLPLNFARKRVAVDGNSLRPQAEFTAVIVCLVLLAGVSFLAHRKQQANLNGPGEFQDVDEMMLWLSAQAVKHAQGGYGVQLDYSVQSIEQVEEVLGRMNKAHESGKLTSGVKELSMIYGAYIGEAIRRDNPGSSWGTDHAIVGRNSYPMTWGGGDSFPDSWCYKRIMNGPEDNVWAKYLLLKRERDQDMGNGIIFDPAD